jgi:hypothetical protein
MEITKKGKFITDFYGSAPALGAEGILQKWIDDKQTAWLASWAEQVAKKGQTAIQALEEILSVFHRDIEGKPVIGNWMLRRCLIVTGQAIFNAKKNNSHPKKQVIPMAIQLVEPININIHNGKILKVPDGVKTYTCTVKNRSFFKAYEFIKVGTTFDATIFYDEELLSEEHMNQLLEKAGSIGVGAFRERFGKFEWVN